MAVGSIAFDLVNLSRRLDMADGSIGPTARNLQSAWTLAMAINSMVRDIKAPGAGSYVRSEAWTAAHQADYETQIDNLDTALIDVAAALATIVNSPQ
jgi:hypothetical protein